MTSAQLAVLKTEVEFKPESFAEVVEGLSKRDYLDLIPGVRDLAAMVNMSTTTFLRYAKKNNIKYNPADNGRSFVPTKAEDHCWVKTRGILLKDFLPKVINSFTLPEIAEYLDVSHNDILNFCHSHNIKPPRFWTKKRKDCKKGVGACAGITWGEVWGKSVGEKVRL